MATDQLVDLKLRIDEISHLRRRQRHSVDATGIALRRTLAVGSRTRQESWEPWPRPRQRQSHSHRLPVVLLPLLMVVLPVAIGQWRQPTVQVSSTSVTTESIPSSQPVSVVGPHSSGPLVIHIRAIRPCRVRVTVDGMVLDWRLLNQDDEFFSHPRRDMFIQTTDGGALSAAINGKPVTLGPDGQAAAVRLTSAGLVTEPAE